MTNPDSKLIAVVLESYLKVEALQHQIVHSSTRPIPTPVDPSVSTEAMDTLRRIISFILPCYETEDTVAEPPSPITVQPWKKSATIRIRENYSSRDLDRIYLMHQLNVLCEQGRCLNRYLFTQSYKDTTGISLLPYIKPRGCIHYKPTDEELARFFFGSGRDPMQIQEQQPFTD